MHKNMKLLLALAGINLLALPSAFAQSWIEYGDRGDLAYSPSRRNAAAGDYGSAFSDYRTSVSGEVFYAAATEDAVSSLGLDGADLGGVSARFSAEKHRTIASGAVIVPEFFGIFSLGLGSEDWTYSGYRAYEDGDYDVLVMQFAVGANLRCYLTESFSLFGGARIGFAYESVDMEFSGYDSYGNYSGSADDSDVGFLYGVGVGGQVDFSDSAALVFGIDYVGMTAEPEVGGIKTDEQAYMMFSVGYKHKF